MFQHLDPAFFVANVFTTHSDLFSIDFVSLRKVRDHVTEQLASQNVMIEWTREAVIGSLKSYPDLFENHGCEVVWLGSRSRDSVKQFFDDNFDDSFLDQLQEVIQETTI
jgi:hypothetical protein